MGMPQWSCEPDSGRPDRPERCQTPSRFERMTGEARRGVWGTEVSCRQARRPQL